MPRRAHDPDGSDALGRSGLVAWRTERSVPPSKASIERQRVENALPTPRCCPPARRRIVLAASPRFDQVHERG